MFSTPLTSLTLLMASLLSGRSVDPPIAEVLQEVLQIVSERFVDPARLDSAHMLDGAVERLARRLGTSAEHDERGYRLSVAGRVLEIPNVVETVSRVPDGRDLVAALAPSLDAAMRQTDAARAAPIPTNASERRLPTRPAVLGALLGGALAPLDRYSRALTGKGRRAIHQRYTGHMTGVGARIGPAPLGARVLGLYAGSGGRAAGLRVGDVIVAVDDDSVVDVDLAEIGRRMRGRAGTQVKLTLSRRTSGAGGPSIVVTRRRFTVSHVSSRVMGGGTGMVRIGYLSRRAPNQLARALEGLEGSGGLTGLVVDLRGNQGGSVRAATEIADLFLTEGELTRSVDRHGDPVPGLRPVAMATPSGRPDLPLVVLVDRRTASSAELLTALLLRHDRAVVIGARTFGKNIIQKLYEFQEWDLSLRLTIAYMHAAGRPLSSVGIDPDIHFGTGSACPDPVIARLVGPESALDERAAKLLNVHGDPSRAVMLRRVMADSRLSCRD